jgi:hypothetical protein
VIGSFLLRVGAGGLYSHVLFTGLTGMGFAYLVAQRGVGLPKRLGGAALLVAAGFAAHAVWNSPVVDFVLNTSSSADPSILQWIAWASLKGLPFLLLLVVMVRLATRSEERNYRAIVAGEPDPMVVTDDEMRSLGSIWARRSARRTAGRAHGSVAARLVGMLQAAQIEYAMIRSRSDSLADPELDSQRLKIRRLRFALSETPFRSSALGSGTALQTWVGVPGPQIWLVPPGGIPTWPTPDATRLPAIVLPERLELVVEARTGSWAEVRSANGWRGWVDGRLLVEER